MSDQKPQRIGCFWKAKSKAGKLYINGVIETPDGEKMTFVGFRNSYKKQDKDPDYVLYKSQSREEASGAKKSLKPSGATKPFKRRIPEPTPVDDLEDDGSIESDEDEDLF